MVTRRKVLFVVGMVAAYPAGLALAVVLHHVNLYRLARRAA